MAAPENPTEPFKRALAHAARALAEQPDLEVSFASDGPRLSGHELILPHPTRGASEAEAAALREVPAALHSMPVDAGTWAAGGWHRPDDATA